MKIVVLGLSITSSWGNGHATTFRGLLRELARRGHDILFLERDQSWYAENRDFPKPPFCRVALYNSLSELTLFAHDIAEADCVIVGSYVPEGAVVGEWVTRTARGVTAFYDIDTPVTLRKLSRGEHEYLSPDLVSKFDLYLSFSGGPILDFLEEKYGSPAARAFYCSVDPADYFPERTDAQWDLGYLGTYSEDRHATLARMLLEPARELGSRRF